MVTERLGTGKNHPPLPMRDTRRENAVPPAIKLHLEQINKQLMQIVGHLQQLNHQIKTLQDEGMSLKSTDISQMKMDNGKSNHDFVIKKHPATYRILGRLGRRGKIVSYTRIVLVFSLIIGIVSALFSATILFFYGPVMG